LLLLAFPALAGWANICRAYGATRGESKSGRGKPRHYKATEEDEDAALKGRRYETEEAKRRCRPKGRRYETEEGC